VAADLQPPYMKTLEQFSRLIRANPKAAEDPEDDDRVLTLFRNRAELKKAYGELQAEVYRLQDRIKQQEGATARVQEMLGSLETRLGLDNLDAICATDGVDGVFIGPADLSAGLGHLGDMAHPEVKKSIDDAIKRDF